MFAVAATEMTKSEHLLNVVETNDDGNNGAYPTPANNIDTVITQFFCRIFYPCDATAVPAVTADQSYCHRILALSETARCAGHCQNF